MDLGEFDGGEGQGRGLGVQRGVAMVREPRGGGSRSTVCIVRVSAERRKHF